MCFVAGTLGQGGAERQLYYMITALRDSGALPEALCLTCGEFWETRIKALGVPVTWVGQQASRLARLARIIREVRTRRPDVVQSQHFYTNLYAYGAARALGVREIGAVRCDAASEVRDNGAVLGRISLHAPQVVVANSANAVRNARAMGVPASRLRLLLNAVDTVQFEPAAHASTARVTLLAVGRLVAVKRFDRLLTAVAAMKDESCAWRLVIAGDGPLRGALEQQAAQLGLLPDFVEFHGAVSSVAPLYQQADVVVVTSDVEGTPNVILEAMASRLPVVSTGVGGVPDLVQHGDTGFLVDGDDPVALPTILRRMVADRDLRIRMGDRARALVLAHHALSRLPERLERLYGSVLS